MEKEALTVKNLAFGYDRTEIIKGISLSVRRGEFLGIIGPNGSGKSTLIKLVSGYLKPTSGEVSLFGRHLSTIRRREAARLAGVVPQEMGFYFPYKVEQFVQMGRHPYQGLTATETDEDRRFVRQALEATDTYRLKNRSVLELSGGEKQRVILAAALAQNTEILYLDEPTSSLDLHYQIEIYDILKRMNAERNLTVVAVTHDFNLGALYCDRLLLVADGKIVADGPPSKIIEPGLLGKHFKVEVECVIRKDSDMPFVIPTGRKIP